MNINTIRSIIASMFMVCFLACIAALFVAQNKTNVMAPESFDEMLKTLVPLYMTPIGVILGVLFGSKALGRSKDKNAAKKEMKLSSSQFLFALASVLIWNSLIVTRFWRYAYGAGTEETLVLYLHEVVPLSAPLISVVLAAIFSD